jgi:hypothetical protein
MTTLPETKANEAITSAERTAENLVSEICAAHRLACEDSPLLEILLRDQIAAARTLQMRLKEIAFATGVRANQ